MIYYFIFNGPFNSGVGGHYNSLRVTASAVAKHRPVKVVVLGERDTNLFRKVGLDSVFVKTTMLSQGSALARLVRMIRDDGGENSVLHAFDPHAFFFVRTLSFFLGMPCCYTKCGGPSMRYIPKASDIVLFSGEDVDYYRKRSTYDDCTLHLIPNRVPLPTRNEARLGSIGTELQFGGVRLVRITRIGHYYRKTMEDAVNLLREMQREGIDARLYFVGKVTEPEVYEAFAGTEGVVFLTDERHYHHASELIPLFDVVIGTGRSAMEGLSYGKPVLAPAENTSLPRLVNDDTIDAFRYYNFSERTVLSEDVVNMSDDYRALVRDLTLYEEQSRCYFKEHFFVESAVSEYMNVVYKRKKKEVCPLDFVLHCVLTQAKFSLDTVRRALGDRQYAVKRFVDGLAMSHGWRT